MLHPPRNFVSLCVDDFRPSALGSDGDPLAPPPNMDQLARHGLLFERASFLTGRRLETFPRIGEGVQDAHYREVLPYVATLPQLFKENGYHTESIGKVNHAHPPILDSPSWSVPEQLIDVVKQDEYLLAANRLGGSFEPMKKGEATARWDVADRGYVDGRAAAAEVEALGRLVDVPFFLAVGMKKPHLPWGSPEHYWAMHGAEAFALSEEARRPVSRENLQRFPWRHEFKPKSGEIRPETDIPVDEPILDEKARQSWHGYYAAASYDDAQLGLILDELDRLNFAERTIVVFWADHGYHLGENGQWGKKTNAELDLQVPLLVAAPGVTRPGTRTRAMVELVGLYSTLADLAGLPEDPELKGSSFVPVLKEPKTKWKMAVFSQHVRGCVRGAGMRMKHNRYVEWTNVHTGEVVDRELYNLGTDPLEGDNLAARHEEDVAVHTLCLRWGWRAGVPEIAGSAGAMDRSSH